MAKLKKNSQFALGIAVLASLVFQTQCADETPPKTIEQPGIASGSDLPNKRGPLSAQKHPSQKAQKREPSTPNIVLVVVDTERADATGPFGAKHDTTPFMSQLAAQGVTFSNMFSSAPWTAPAMFSMMTGLYPSEHGVTNGSFMRVGKENKMVGQQILPDEAVTLAERLKEHGYMTFGVCTNHHLRAKFGFSQGFDHYVGDDFHTLPFPTFAVSALSGTIRSTSKYFLWLHYFDPHFPYTTHAPWFGQWNDSKFTSYLDLATHLVQKKYREQNRIGLNDPVSLDDVPLLTSTSRNLASYHMNIIKELTGNIKPAPNDEYSRFLKAAYLSEISETDEAIKDAFATLNIDEETLVVVTSDHGEEIFDRGNFGHRHSSLYQELIRVPLIIRLPGGEGAGKVVDTPVSVVDIVPTLLDIIGQPVPEDLSGESLVPLIDGRKIDPRPIYAEVERPTKRCLVEFPWKYIHNFANDRGELYNLRQDPEEKSDLSKQEASRAAAMRSRLKDWAIATKPRWRTERLSELSEEEIKQLKRMGYIL